ncbi:MAG: ATP-dependent Clp protease proteolytic subunit [Leptonema sp. (in: bacteria)]
MNQDAEKLLENFAPIKSEIEKNYIKKRQIFLWGVVDDKSAQYVVDRLLYLDSIDPGKDIYLFINSPGGVITSGMCIFDTMQMIRSQVATVCMGLAASMGALLLCGGAKGKRYAWAHSKIMIHQPLISGQIVAPAIDLKIHAQEIKKTREELNKIISERTGRSLEQVEKDTDRDYYMSAEEALEYGIIDKIMSKL